MTWSSFTRMLPAGFISVELNFQKLFILFCIFAIVSGVVFKLKVLNK